MLKKEEAAIGGLEGRYRIRATPPYAVMSIKVGKDNQIEGTVFLVYNY